MITLLYTKTLRSVFLASQLTTITMPEALEKIQGAFCPFTWWHVSLRKTREVVHLRIRNIPKIHYNLLAINVPSNRLQFNAYKTNKRELPCGICLEIPTVGL